MNIEILEMGSMAVKCYVLYQEGHKEAIVIDPGDYGDKIYQWLGEHGLECSAIFLTHGHFDHILGIPELKELSGALVYSGSAEKQLLADKDLNVSERIRRPISVVVDGTFDDNQVIDMFGMQMKCIHTPGHTAGSVCFYLEEEKALICGDTLFKQGYGRTDLPTGNTNQLFDSIRNKLFKLPKDTVCYPGHGEATTIGNESAFFGY